MFRARVACLGLRAAAPRSRPAILTHSQRHTAISNSSSTSTQHHSQGAALFATQKSSPTARAAGVEPTVVDDMSLTKDAASPAAETTVVQFNKDKDIVSASLPQGSFSTHLCDGPSEQDIEVSGEKLREIFRLMNVARRTEVAADLLYKAKAIRGFLHLYNGQEAVALALRDALTLEDHVITAYRCHAHMLERGGTPEQVLAEMCGKTAGSAKGKGGSMHMYLAKGRFHGGNGIVGAQIPIGAGLAFAEKYKATKNVAVTFYGDGAANQGQAFEAYNMAKLWDLPCIFVTENNKYGMGTTVERSSADTNFYKRAGYIPGVRFDGMNLFASIAAFRYAADWCRSGKGPFMLEAETYRYYGHSMSDPGLSYRTKDEVKRVRETRDPINFVKKVVSEQGIMTAEEIKTMEKEVKAQVDKAVEFSKSEPDPEPQELYTDVLAREPYFVRAVNPEDSRPVSPRT